MRRLYEWKYMNPPTATGNNNSSNTTAGNNTSKVLSYKEKFKELLKQLDKEKKFTYNVITITDNALVLELALDAARKITIAIIYKPYTSPPVWKVGVNNLAPLDYKDWNEVLDVFEVPGIIDDVSSLKESFSSSIVEEFEVYNSLKEQLTVQQLFEWKLFTPNSYKNKIYHQPSVSGISFSKKEKASVDCVEVVAGEKEVYANTFGYFDNLKEVILPDSLERIGAFAFAHCHSLQKVNLPSSLKYIDDNAFYDCSNSLTVTCDKGSYAEQFAKSKGITIVYTNSSFAEEFETYNNLWK